ncbi:hypothetical protein MTO96_029521 [Rhipicephalus appendiculatus]
MLVKLFEYRTLIRTAKDSLTTAPRRVVKEGLLRDRADWILHHQVLSRFQKGFLPADGVFEQNYVFQHRLDAARSGGADLCAALLDFTNAYGSVTHTALLDALRGAGAGDTFTALIQDLYTDNSTCLIAEEGVSDPVPMRAGREAEDHNILTYADDLTLATSPSQLQRRIDRVEALATALGLALNPAKCTSLHMSGITPVGMRPIRVTVSGVAIEALRNHDPQRFHGRPVGFELRLTDSAVVDTAINQARKILSSMLAPWQRLDAVRTFVYPALNFAMRCGVLRKTDWKRLDDAVRPLVKRTLYLPSNAANGCVHGSTRAGAVALPIAAKLSDVCRVDNA